jgi:serine/threonine-protein kinase
VAIVIALAAGFGALAVATKMFTPSVTIPSVVGDTNAKARTTLSNAHLNAVYAPANYSTTVADGSVISQDPASGKTLKQGSSVTLVLSRGLPPVTVPSLTNMNCQQATAALTAVNLSATCPPEAAAYSDSVAVNLVVGYTYNNTSNPKTVPYNGAVILVISKGPTPISVPSVAGSSYATAQGALAKAGFTSITQSGQFSSSVPAGQVIGTSPTAGSMAQKTDAITVYVSLGPGAVIPSGLIGSSPVAASNKVTNAGLVPSLVGCGSSVKSVSPASGTTVAKGSTVTLHC